MLKRPADLGDREQPLRRDLMPVVIILDNLRSAYNTGNIFRIADAVRVRRVVGCGYTPLPPHDKLAKTARGCDQTVASEHVPDIENAIRSYRLKGYYIYGVESGQETVSAWDAQMNFPAAFVFGNEALGISDVALSYCDQLINLPCLGYKHSINVGNCAAVIMYESLKQWRLYDRTVEHT